MANTYTQIYIHVVFAVQGRQNLIRHQHKDELQKYMTGIITHKEQKLIAINNMPDHFHLLIGLKPSMALSDLVGDIKAGSSGSSTRATGYEADSAGRKVSVPSLTHILNSVA